jgi:hypothetical protein
MASLPQFVILCTGSLVLPEIENSATKMGANITVYSSLPDIESPCKGASFAAALEASLLRRSRTLQSTTEFSGRHLLQNLQNDQVVGSVNSGETATHLLLSLFREHDTARLTTNTQKNLVYDIALYTQLKLLSR